MSEADAKSSDYSPSYRQKTVDETLDDHEERITRNERWRLVLKGAIVGLALASGSQQAVGQLVTFL